MDVNNTKDFIRQQRFPDRLHLILYLVQSNETTCVYHQAEELHCEKETVYPLNRLRNIAIQNIQTTHFIVFDMDMWPSSTVIISLSCRTFVFNSSQPSYQLFRKSLCSYHNSCFFTSRKNNEL